MVEHDLASGDFSVLLVSQNLSEEEVGSKAGKRFSRATKAAAYLRDALPTAPRCFTCGGLLYLNSIETGHHVHKRDRGPAVLSNAIMQHPSATALGAVTERDSDGNYPKKEVNSASKRRSVAPGWSCIVTVKVLADELALPHACHSCRARRRIARVEPGPHQRLHVVGEIRSRALPRTGFRCASRTHDRQCRAHP